MNKFYCFAITAIFLTGCSSAATVKTNTKTAENRITETNIVVNKTIASTANQSNSNVEIPVNANRVVLGNTLISKDNDRKWIGKKGGSKEDTPIAENIGKITSAAPDNSEISSQTNEKGQPMETRVFVNNSALAKIERVYVTMENPKITVYLKNGKAVNVPNGKIENPLTATAKEILRAAGQN